MKFKAINKQREKLTLRFPTFIVKTKGFKPLSIDSEETASHDRCSMWCPSIGFLCYIFSGDLVPFKYHVPVDQTKQIFRNKFVVKGSITYVIDLWTYYNLKIQKNLNYKLKKKIHLLIISYNLFRRRYCHMSIYLRIFFDSS